MKLLAGVVEIQDLMPTFGLLKRRLIDIVEDIEAEMAIQASRTIAEKDMFKTALNRFSKGRFSKIFRQLIRVKGSEAGFFKRRAALAKIIAQARESEAFEAHLDRLRHENVQRQQMIARQAENLEPLKAALMTLPKIERLCVAAMKSGVHQLELPELDLRDAAPQSTLNQVSVLARASQAVLKMARPEDLAQHLK